MSAFDDRKKAAENKLAHDEEMKFKVAARRNKLFGLWAAEQMGIKGDAAEKYAKDVVAADLEQAGDEDVYRKVAADLKKKGVDLSEHRIRRQMSDLLAQAAKEVGAK